MQHPVALDKKRGDAAFGQAAVGGSEQNLVAIGTRPACLVVKGAVAGLVAQAEICAVDRKRYHCHTPGRAFLQRPDLDRQRPAFGGQQPYLGQPVQMEGCGMQPVAGLVPVKFETEDARAFLHAFQMQFQPQYTLRRFKAHCFNQIKTGPAHLCKIPLCQTFRPFGVHVGIRNDAGPQPQ
ncbi:hypothetical protein FOM92_12635 [Sphingorhabdus contaminans]|uniref:Uncharacterized protein n=1 Tax=Sphingorhabdus contaminans TaxID=1343899 RepID=A0A553WBB4_9SPHN|nr:hypothetical protein FOM92_12635 [Sphingorhabdus contaminans]